jgi:glycerol 2-dehydrogenase (NADP+)
MIPKSVTPERIDSNFEMDNWSLSEAETTELDRIQTRSKVVGDAWMPIRVFFGDGM